MNGRRLGSLAVGLLVRSRGTVRVQPRPRWIQVSSQVFDSKWNEKRYLKEKKDTELVSAEIFDAQVEKDKQTFRNAIEIFKNHDIRRRGAVEFIRAALKHMDAFGVNRDIEVYRSLISVLPKGKYVPENMIQASFKHYPKQQDCIVEVLHKMEANWVVPDMEMGELLKDIFGINGLPYKKFARMIYWMPKLKNQSPWPLPFEVPNDALELAKMAVQRITSVDVFTELSIYRTEDVPDAIEKTWIVSGISPDQKEIIANLPKDKALYVEGAFRVWLRKSQVNYFILRGDPVPRPPPPEGDIDDISQIRLWMYGQRSPNQTSVVKIPTVHEQEDGTILACCATGTSSKDSLLSWIRLLQKENPGLENVPILFTLQSPLGPVVPIDENEETALKK